mmetsp:Transcript_31905/g.61032  ORF Transcript_31905/g.61032 Transcript_31905/m.61032 type:complete len:1706 (-) Transcript_31905:400-5517(-)
MKTKQSKNPFDNTNGSTSNISASGEIDVERNDNNPNDGITGGKYDDGACSSPSTPTSSTLFPAWLSSWMTSTPIPSHHHPDYNPPENEDDDSCVYHDCLSNVDSSSSMEGDETTNLLLANETVHHDILSPLRQRPVTANESTQIRMSGYATMMTENLNSSMGNQDGNNDTARLHHDELPNPHQSIGSPLSQALATWLSPYADSAKRAGRRLLFFSEDPSADQEIGGAAGADENSNLLGKSDAGPEGIANETTVRWHPDYKSIENEERNSKRKENATFLSRVSSSPALMTTFADERGTNAGETDGINAVSARRTSQSTYSTIVLKDIDVQGDNNHSEDGTVIHPWTKLILLEELGTAWSWFVLLLPYAFMILAVILDGDATLRNASVGPLFGNRSCAEMVQGSVPTPFDASVKGYFPVPFPLRFKDADESGSNRTSFSGSCTYPFELREGVGILSNGKYSGSNLTSSSTSSMTSERISIIDARYRYYMSHGHAFTSGVISNVPPTSQSLSGYVKFTKLSSKAVALVARGSVLVSAIVFQRQTPEGGNPYLKQWSPVLILSSKRLDMICKLNGQRNDGGKEASSWNCTSRQVLNAFFSLPNTAVLTGEDLRVDILLSHDRVYKSLKEDIWINERGGITGADDDYAFHNFNDNFVMSDAEKILSSADVSHPQDLLAEMSTKSMYMLQHQSNAYNNVVEVTRIFALTITMIFLCYWLWSMGRMNEVSDSGTENEDDAMSTRVGEILSLVWKLIRGLSRYCTRSNLQTFWWEDPWTTFPSRRYLLLLLCCLIMLQNPLLVFAFFHPSLYSSAKFRFAADSLSGMSVHGILFLWLCIVHGLRYHTADIARRRLSQRRRVLELRTCIDDAMDHRHTSLTHDIEDNQWGRVRWYYQQYGDVDGSGAISSMALRMKHDINSDSFVEFILPKLTLLVIGIVACITAAASRFPMSESPEMSERVELNPDRIGSGSKVYAVSSIVQLILTQTWCILIVYTGFVTGERLRREPFLSTRPSQLAFRVLSSILLLGAGFSISLFYFHSLNFLGTKGSTSINIRSGYEVSYDTSIGGDDDSWDSKADILFRIIRNTSTALPYVGTASNIGPGKILYATACSLVVAYIFLPSSHFRPSKKELRKVDEVTMGPDQSLSNLDKRLQGKDKRFVVALARNTHTWRVFPLPTRSHGLLSQHTLKETLHIVGTFQLDGRFESHKLKFGRGAIYKGRYIPVFCVEIACWLLEASWQAYYSPLEYSLNNWAPGRMRLDSIGLKLEHAINDSETDTHAFVASNISEQVEGEEDSIIVVAFRGSASISNIKTDLSFRQVPLPENLMSDVPAFNVRPGMPITVDETLWDAKDSSSQSIHDILRQPSGKYTSWPTKAAKTTSTDVDQMDRDQSHLIPAVSSGAKAIIRATPMARQALPCVHEGFLQNYSNVRKEIIEAIISVLKRQLDKSVDRSRHGGSSSNYDGTEQLTLPKIYCTGHSMGGAIAQLLAIDLASNCEIVIEQPISKDKTSSFNRGEIPSNQSQSSLESDDEEAEEPPDTGDIYWLGQKLAHQSTPTKKIRLRPPIAVYTYGQSRLGNHAFKTIYKRRVPHTFRVATEGDAITTIPTVGPCCGGIYRHAGLEVLLEEGCTGNILVGPTIVETLLRFTKVRTSMAAHSMDRYRESLESALEREELKEYYRGHGGKVRHDNQGAYSGNGASLPSWVTSVKRSHDI